MTKPKIGNWNWNTETLQRTCLECGGIEFEVDPPFCKWCGIPMDDRMGKRVKELSSKIKQQTENAGLPFWARMFNTKIFENLENLPVFEGIGEENKMPKTVWANALLSDGKILFWYTGSKCNSADDFYKDFYYAGINQMQYEKSHKLELVCKELDASDNHKTFDIDAPEFYKQYQISFDSKGKKPYGENEPFVPPLSEQIKEAQKCNP